MAALIKFPENRWTGPRPIPQALEEDFPAETRPEDVLEMLRDCIAKGGVAEVCVLIADEDDNAALISTLQGEADNIHFMEKMKLEILTGANAAPEPPPKRSA